MNVDLIEETHLCLSNESSFYSMYLCPLYKASEKYFKKGNYDADKFTEALQSRIRLFVSSSGKYQNLSKEERTAVAKMFQEYHLDEMKLGNFHGD